jgi:hypothetical protein
LEEKEKREASKQGLQKAMTNKEEEKTWQLLSPLC